MDKKKQIKFNMNNFLLSTNMALDFMQYHRVGTSMGHGKRVAYIALRIGIKYELDAKELSDLCSYSLASNLGLSGCFNEKSFCEIANESVKDFVFQTEKENILLYQKENYDGSGPFELKGDEIPLFSQIIYLAKSLDDKFDLGTKNIKKRFEAVEFVKAGIGNIFSEDLVDKFFECVNDISFWEDMFNESDTLALIYSSFEDYTAPLDFEQLVKITRVFHLLENFSSRFLDVCSLVSDFYEFDHKDKMTFLTAAGLSNIGKLSIGRNILDKKEPLDLFEIETIKAYPYYTKKMLSNIIGFADITSWAVKVQERLDGSGYVNSLEGKDLAFKDRLLATLYAYNSLRENREYRQAYTHNDAIDLLKFESSENKFDEAIIKDLEEIFKES